MQIEKIERWDGRDIFRFWLENTYCKIGILNFGGILQSFQVKTPEGSVEIVVGPESVADYLREGRYASAAIGRMANRLEKGRYIHDGKQYQTSVNDGDNMVHGGINGFDKKIYDYKTEGDVLVLSYVSPDGEEGFPGNLTMQIYFQLWGNSLHIRFEAQSDRDTVFAPTYHPYFRLTAGAEPIYDTLLMIPAFAYLPVREDAIPTGQLCPVAGTPFDFTSEKPIGCDIFSKDPQIAQVNGYDHCFAVDGELKASAFCKSTGIRLDVSSDMPGVQLYTTNNGGAFNSRYLLHGAFCLEPEFFPNAMNEEGFIKPLLPAHTKVEHTICYTVTLP